MRFIQRCNKLYSKLIPEKQNFAITPGHSSTVSRAVQKLIYSDFCRPIFSRYFRRLWGNVAENRRTSHLPSRKQAVFRVLWISAMCSVRFVSVSSNPSLMTDCSLRNWMTSPASPLRLASTSAAFPSFPVAARFAVSSLAQTFSNRSGRSFFRRTRV